MADVPRPNPNAPDNSILLDFLYKSLDDTQSTIRFLDAKAAIALAPLGFMVAKVLEVQYENGFPRERLSLIVEAGFFAAAAVCLWIAVMVFFPMSNPREHVDLEPEQVPEFFVAGTSDAAWWTAFWTGKSHFRLSRRHAAYLTDLRASTVERFVTILAGEVLKVSLIRELKNHRLGVLAKLLLVTFLLFLAFTFGTRKLSEVRSAPPPTINVLNESPPTDTPHHEHSSRSLKKTPK